MEVADSRLCPLEDSWPCRVIGFGVQVALLEQLPPDMPVQAEGCDCVNEVKGVGVYRHGPDDEKGPQCILVADNDYYGVLGPTFDERTATARRAREQARQEEPK